MAKKKVAADKSSDQTPAEQHSTQPPEENNRCFIITPIGDENSPIRRATDGLIDSAIGPVLARQGIDVSVAHRDRTPRSIGQSVIKSIVESRLVIANVTGLNPNVMYELAVRHSAAKPIIVLAENGTDLPFDIHDEFTLFYSDDMAGVAKLKVELAEAIKAALALPNVDNPAVRYFQGALAHPGKPQGELSLLLERFARLERVVSDWDGTRNAFWAIPMEIAGEDIEEHISSKLIEIVQALKGSEISIDWMDHTNPNSVRFGIRMPRTMPIHQAQSRVMEVIRG